ncbi:MAG: aldehyde ferredoxin oxidoreductase family protein [Proteobacteria bacterium]|nr:aldehyde ferredoxin oxidoreductase family protein [Pseudomonadota bacterium]
MVEFNKGYMGKMLRVNLSTGEAKSEDLPEELVKKYIGGRSMGVKLLYDELAPGTDPLSPENKMIFLTGPLAGTPAQSCSRWLVISKSPLTGGYCRSVAGGGFGAEVKAAGFDVLIVEGKADKPSYLWIKDGEVEIRDAGKLLGMLCSDTSAALREELGDKRVKVVNVGPAGEKMVRFSAIFDDQRLAARGGMGMVMWSKNLKAIAVRGSKKVEVADRETLRTIAKSHVKTIKESPRYQVFAHMGTAAGVDGCHPLGILPVKNFRDGVLENVEELMSDKVEKIFVKDALCYRCHIQCGRILKVESGPYAGEVKGPEYESMFSLGASLCVTNLEMVVAANGLCDEYGVDAISAGATIAFAMECYEKGILTKEDLGGLDLTWGNHEAVFELLKMTLNREGIGDILAEGSRVAAEKIGKGSKQYAMEVKGLELAGYEPRSLKASGLNLSTIALGANHTTGQSPQEFAPPGTPGAVDRFSKEGKGPLCKGNQESIAIVETGISCIFPKAIGLIDIPTFSKMLYAATGIEEFKSEAYLSEVAERTITLERAFNVRDGFSRKDDYLPDRLINETPTRGPVNGQKYEMDYMLDDYYKAQDWDPETGYPKAEKLEKVGLASVAEELKQMGKIS